ncbi:MAG: hypothetical protein RI885_736, partial [Actinomycetota bacterium]
SSVASSSVASSPRAAEPHWQTITATSADDFVDSVGVNVHMNFTDTRYGDERQTLALLHNLGVRHVRDGLESDDPDYSAALRAFRDAGIDASLIAGGSFDQPNNLETIEGGLEALTDPDRLLGVASSIEGTNEPDCDEWDPAIRVRQQQLIDAVRAVPELDGIPVLTPSGCRQVGSVLDYSEEGEVGPDADAWNLHPYPGEYTPEAGLPGSYPDADLTAEGQFEAAKSAADRPVWATETGYSTALNNPDEGAIPISEDAAGSYIPRILLENARLGIERSFLYELHDERPDPGLTDPEQAFGLIRYDGTPKPAYESVQALLTTLADPGLPVEDRAVKLGIAKAPDDLRRMAFARSDGSVDLVLWRAVSVWDTETDDDDDVADMPIEVSTRKAAPVSIVRLAEGTTRTVLGSRKTTDVEVGPTPVIVRFGKSTGVSAVEQWPIPAPETSTLSTPGRPGASGTTGYSTTLTWGESVGDAGVNVYIIYRDGRAIARVEGTEYLDTGLNAATTYRYEIRAVDQSGGTTDPSPALDVSTAAVDSTARYSLVNAGDGSCLDAEARGTASGTAIIGWRCNDQDNQHWMFVPTTTGSYTVLAAHDPDLAWDLDGATGSSSQLQLWRVDEADQFWSVERAGASGYRLLSADGDSCLGLVATASGSRAQQVECDSSSGQRFELVSAE